MKLRDSILLSLTVGFLIIGVHQTMMVGFQKAYWALMICLILFFTYGLSKKPKATNTIHTGKSVNQKDKAVGSRPTKSNRGKRSGK
jgi:hypothetical protein